ncbi:serine hydrolase domain-containing protein [Kribbella sancticallisti]|uniref:Serine hydrolase domain-containing protein n=1 Tax=Kribbella sancticallisti TaxID=460087 RepID=A0ABP4PYU2_9ACTN
MKRGLRALLTATTVLAVIATPAAAIAVPAKPDRAELQSGLDEVVAVSAVGALAEVRDEQGVWRSTSGVAERGTTRPVAVNNRFRAGSITKTFLATVVLQLADEDRLRLDDTVGAWLPGVVPNGHRITVRHLLNHTSGVPDYRPTLILPPEPGFLENRWRTWTAAELIQRAVATPPTFQPPGSAFAYSNTNYLLLGQIVEKATRHSYGEEIERRVIRPLHLHGTSMPGTDRKIRGPHLNGYVPIRYNDNEAPQLVDFTAMNPSLFGAGGELISTTKDLNRFFKALLTGDLLPPHLLDEMKTPGTKNGTYGLGLAWRDTTCGPRIYGNDGDAVSYQSYAFTTEDGHHQAAIALTPDFRTNPDKTVDKLLDKAFCP